MTTREFLKFFTGSVFQTFKDRKDGNGFAKIFLKYDEAEFQKMQRLGCGIYFTPNFCEGGRVGTNLVKLNAVFADLDVAKEEDGLSLEEIKSKKAVLKNALLGDIISPNFIIDTKNGLQPIWLLEDIELTEENKVEFTLTIKGIIEWSKRYGCKGDKVYDLVHVIRLPGYFHLKGEPYKCEVEEVYTDKVPLKYLRETFLYEEPKKEAGPVKQFKKGLISIEIDNIDIRELMERAFAYVGRRLEFDKQGRMIVDGRLTGNFQGKQGGGGFIASTSHEAFDGNRVTAVAKVLGVTTKEAYVWIKEQYGLNEGMLKAKGDIEKIQVSQVEVQKKGFMPYTWGTPDLDDSVWALKKHELFTLLGTSESGKTAYAYFLARMNARLGHKVLYIVLEMSAQEIRERVAHDRADYTIEEDRMQKYPPEKKEKYDIALKEFNNLRNLVMVDIPKGVNPTVEFLTELIKAEKPDLVIIDNFDLITMSPEIKNSFDSDNHRIMTLQGFSKENLIPIGLVHHVNSKKRSRKGGFGLSDVRGSGKIIDQANIHIMLSRDNSPEATLLDKKKLYLRVSKLRRKGSSNISVQLLYFHQGDFYDSFSDIENLSGDIRAFYS